MQYLQQHQIGIFNKLVRDLTQYFYIFIEISNKILDENNQE